MDAVNFYSSVRESLFNGKLKQGVVDTLNSILASCDKFGVTNLRQQAYVMATAKHEAYHPIYNPNFDPVREGYSKTNAGAIKAVTRLYTDKVISKNYALPQSNGLSYYGRGLVQITHPGNYKALGKRLRIPLYENPDLALQRDHAADILVVGMKEGIFTGRKLSTYFNENIVDNLNARRIINGIDQQERIAAVAVKFYAALIA
jgi:putative chitinase